MTPARWIPWCWFLLSLSAPSSALATTQPPLGPLLWDGSDPFHQPAQTTSYHGSGDLDGDGHLTSADIALLQQMVNAARPPRPEADVNGDGRVDLSDAGLLQNALPTGNLPGAWNRLTSRTAREAWLSKALAVDTTNAHDAYSYWNQCLGFATQTFVNFSYYRGDLHSTYLSGGPTVFNIPTYIAIVYSETYGHAINAVLVGDDPLRFGDWLFFEPQNDQIVRPGMWDLPFDTHVKLAVPAEMFQGGFNNFDKLHFFVAESGATLVGHAPDLILERGGEPPSANEDRPSVWNPLLIPDSDGTILIGGTRRDFPAGHHDDLYVSTLATPEEIGQEPLFGGDDYNRLLDVARDHHGAVHVLWMGKSGSVPGVFYGRLDLPTGRIIDRLRLSEGVRSIRMGRLLAASDGSLHAFWLELMSNSNHPYPTGIYWMSNSGSGWGQAANLAPLPSLSLFDLSSWWYRPDVMRYHFDVEETDGAILLAWNEPKNPPNSVNSDEFLIKTRFFDGAWTPTAVVAEGGSAGVALARDGRNRLHLVYSTDTDRIENRGKLFHRLSATGRDWSPPQRLDSSGRACCARLAAGADADMFVTWMDEGALERGSWRRYDGSSWQSTKRLDGEGRGVWYPDLSRLADGSMAAVWSSRSSSAIGVGAQRLTVSNEPPDGPWLTTPSIPGFQVKVQIGSGTGTIPGTKAASCIAETLCVAGALPDRAEVFLRVVGPRPNGKLWPTLVKFSTSRIQVWIEQTSTGELRHYDLAAVVPGDSALVTLEGLIDKSGFSSAGRSTAGTELQTGRGATSSLEAAEPTPPAGPWLETPALPGFLTKVRVTGANGPIAGQRIAPCIEETLCVSGALPDRAEVFVRVVGPRPNGKLWPTLVKFSTSRVEVWIQQAASGAIRYYDLAPAPPGEGIVPLAGLADKGGFNP